MRKKKKRQERKEAVTNKNTQEIKKKKRLKVTIKALIMENWLASNVKAITTDLEGRWARLMQRNTKTKSKLTYYVMRE